MKTLVIGAHGKIGQRLCDQANAAGHAVRAMVRNPSQRGTMESLGAEVVEGDLEGDFAHALDGCDQVVFAAGSGPDTGLDKTLLIDLWGAVRAIDAARDAGVDHFVLVSSIGTEDPLAGPEAMRPYLAAKRAADLHLQDHGPTYTLMHPGQLTDEPGTGQIRTSMGESDEIKISRDDVAACVLAALQAPPSDSRSVLLLSGERPIHAVFNVDQ